MNATQFMDSMKGDLWPMVAVAAGAFIVGQLLLGRILKGLRAPGIITHTLPPATAFGLLLLGAYYLLDGFLPV